MVSRHCCDHKVIDLFWVMVTNFCNMAQSLKIGSYNGKKYALFVIRQIVLNQQGNFLYLLGMQLSGNEVIPESSLLEMIRLGKIEVIDIPSTAISKRPGDTAIFLLPSEDEANSAYAPSVFRYNYQRNDLFDNRYKDQNWKEQQAEYGVALHDKLLTYQDLVPRFSWKQWSDDASGSSSHASYMFTAIQFSPNTTDDKVRRLADDLFENDFNTPAQVVLKQNYLLVFMDKSPETMEAMLWHGQIQ
jgi:hypothetical protein